jgi:hypothetical protein
MAALANMAAAAHGSSEEEEEEEEEMDLPGMLHHHEQQEQQRRGSVGGGGIMAARRGSVTHRAPEELVSHDKKTRKAMEAEFAAKARTKERAMQEAQMLEMAEVERASSTHTHTAAVLLRGQEGRGEKAWLMFPFVVRWR